MLRTTMRILLLSAALLVLAQGAHAFGWRHGSSLGGWGYGGGWGCGVGCGYGGWGYGAYSLGGWGYRGSGYCGPYCGPYYGGSYGLPGGYVPTGAPAARPMTPVPAPPAAGAPGASYSPSYGMDRDAATLAIQCPAEAKVFVNDRPTTSTGEIRQFVSRGLIPGASYNYHVRIDYVRDSKPVQLEKTVTLAAAQSVQLSVSDSGEIVTAAATGRSTTLVVHLPEEATLYLDGKPTSLQGTERTFSTQQLGPGEAWTEYPVKAVLNRNGQEEVRSARVRLVGGETSELTLDFDAPQLAKADVQRD